MAAGEAGELPLPASLTSFKSQKEVFLTISLLLRDTTSWANSGHEIAWFQHRLAEPTRDGHLTASNLNALSSQVSVSSPTASTVVISGPSYSFTFDRARGSLTKWTVNGQTILDGAPAIAPSFWRPATDNDVPASLPYWHRFGVDSLTSQTRSVEIDTKNPEKAILKAHTFISPPVLAWGWDCEIEYTIANTGTLQIDVKKLTPTGAYPKHVPRIGLNLRLNKILDNVRWFGLGPGESYPDKKSSQRLGIWTVGSVADLQTPYEVPQENGNRMDTRWVTLTDAHGAGVRARAVGKPDHGFSWLASRHSAETIQAARHPPDLVEEDITLLRLDTAVAGVGTAACGPGVREDQLVKCEEVTYGFLLESVGL